MSGIEPRFLGCTARSLGSVPTSLPRLKVAQRWILIKKEAECKDFESIQLGSGAIQCRALVVINCRV